MNEDRKWLTPNHLDAMDWAAFVAGVAVVAFVGWYYA